MNKKENFVIYKNMVYILVIMTIFLFITRIILNIFDFPSILEGSRDIDFKILLLGLENGLINFYNPVENSIEIFDCPPYYLYFWYFIFFPMGLLPFEIGVYIWDLLRLLLTSYVILKAFKIIKNSINLKIFYFTILVGFIIDGWCNNCNFLIVFFLFMSYTLLESDRKWISGLFFVLSTIKINLILFIPVLLIAKKIKLKDLYYYIIPFVFLCLPYIIFPDYFFQMFTNWLNSSVEIQGFTFIDSILWKVLQPSHLMFVGFLFIIIFENIEQFKRKDQIRNVIVICVIFFYIYICFNNG